MKAVSRVVQEWFQSANEDFDVAILLSETDPTRFQKTILFHCQQSVEKSLKGVLCHLKIKFPHTHDLQILFELIPNSENFLKQHFDDICRLSIYAVNTRYPNSIDEQLTLESEKYIELARIVLARTSEMI